MKYLHKLKEKLTRCGDLFSKGDPFAGVVTAMLMAIAAIILLAWCESRREKEIDELHIQIRELRENNYEIIEYLLLNHQ